MWQYIYEKREESFMECERSFFPIKLIQLAYLVFDLSNRVMKLCIETDLTHPQKDETEKIDLT